MENQLLAMRDVINAVGIGRTQLYWIRMSGDFPPPLDLPGRKLFWHREDVLYWLEARRPKYIRRGRPRTQYGDGNERS